MEKKKKQSSSFIPGSVTVVTSRALSIKEKYEISNSTEKIVKKAKKRKSVPRPKGMTFSFSSFAEVE